MLWDESIRWPAFALNLPCSQLALYDVLRARVKQAVVSNQRHKPLTTVIARNPGHWINQKGRIQKSNRASTLGRVA
jgi:hypothetical protein